MAGLPKISAWISLAAIWILGSPVASAAPHEGVVHIEHAEGDEAGEVETDPHQDDAAAHVDDDGPTHGSDHGLSHGADHGADHHDGHAKNLLGFKITGLTAFHHATWPEMQEHMVFGGGPFYERELVPNMLEVEFAVLMCRGHGLTVVPIELILKKPFHPSEHLTTYIGVGPTFDLIFKENGEQYVVPALIATAGGYLWVNSHFGLDLEVAAGHLFEADGFQEVVVSTGPVLHF